MSADEPAVLAAILWRRGFHARSLHASGHSDLADAVRSAAIDSDYETPDCVELFLADGSTKVIGSDELSDLIEAEWERQDAKRKSVERPEPRFVAWVLHPTQGWTPHYVSPERAQEAVQVWRAMQDTTFRNVPSGHLAVTPAGQKPSDGGEG